MRSLLPLFHQSGPCAPAGMELALPRFTILPRVIFKLNNGNNCGIQCLDLGVAPGFTLAFRHLDTQDYC